MGREYYRDDHELACMKSYVYSCLKQKTFSIHVIINKWFSDFANS